MIGAAWKDSRISGDLGIEAIIPGKHGADSRGQIRAV
jgi:hypothetical protein